MNEISTTDAPISHAVMESVLGTGDLSKLTTKQRVEYYMKVCSTLGLNPLTRPFRFMQFQGNTVLYATRDCADQLRNTRKIDLSIVDKVMDGELYIVTARATTADGRHDEDMGAVALGHLKGEARANGMLKAITKAKRRVTLSVCGMGFLDETEVETLAGAVTYDAEVEREVATEAAPPLNALIALHVLNEPNGTKWLKALHGMLSAASTMNEVLTISSHASVQTALKTAPTLIKDQIKEALSDAYARFAAPDEAEATDDAQHEAQEAAQWAAKQESAA